MAVVADMNMAIKQGRARPGRDAPEACSSDDAARAKGPVRFGRPADVDVEKGKRASFRFEGRQVSAMS
ncbi:hypothetical protein MesoLjLc_72740 [Mesorhizobium sp. L-8-10]|nr:hypothetical protein MesoLjLb_71720 [Mesorhizobium sp. L-8-3]BCH35344.1 hypothetical protein MesoLjLc_72740 [Mesorhizobium sp. L-8-10]